MRHKVSKLVLLSTGAALAWFLDPVSGADRRRQLTEQLSQLTGGGPGGSDPTGGATPPSVASVQPLPTTNPDAALAQAVEAAAGGEKLLRTPALDDAAAERSRATLGGAS
jgi:hypothetical protein